MPPTCWCTKAPTRTTSRTGSRPSPSSPSLRRGRAGGEVPALSLRLPIRRPFGEGAGGGLARRVDGGTQLRDLCLDVGKLCVGCCLGRGRRSGCQLIAALLQL